MSTELATIPPEDEPDNKLEVLPPDALPKKKRVISDKQAQKALIEAQVDQNITLLRQRAREDFGEWQVNNGIGHVLVTTNFHNFQQCDNAIKVGLDIMHDAHIPAETKIKAGMMVTQAVKAAKDLSDSLHSLVKELNIKPEGKKHTNAPPNLLIEASGDVHVHENKSSE